MLYHCLRRWPNIEPTLDRRFVFARITTVILFYFLFCNVAFQRFLLGQVGYLRTCASSLLEHSCTCASTCTLAQIFIHLRSCILSVLEHLRTCASTCTSTCLLAHLRTCSNTCSSTCTLAKIRAH